MPPLTINVHVSPRAAIMAGKTLVGTQSFSLTETALQELPMDLRLELALAYESNEAIGSNKNEPDVIEASLAAIRPVLEARAVLRRKHEEAQRIDDARKAELAAVASRDVTAKDNARSKALRAWVEAHGDEEQKARMSEGYLREEEILDEVTAELLDVPSRRVYDVLRRGDACDCACAHRVVFTKVSPPQYMDATQFAKLQDVRDNVPAGAKVEPVEHKAQCPDCPCVPIARITALVTMPWHGWLLAREFSLV